MNREHELKAEDLTEFGIVNAVVGDDTYQGRYFVNLDDVVTVKSEFGHMATLVGGMTTLRDLASLVDDIIDRSEAICRRLELL